MERLITRVRERDETADEQLFEILSVRFRVLAKRRVDADAVEDVAQEACLTVLEKLRSGVRPENFMAWAYDILRNKIGNYYQHREVQRRVIARTPRIEELSSSGSSESLSRTRRRLLGCIRQLVLRKPLLARALVLVYQGHDTDEICERLGVKPEYLYVLLGRARNMLRDCLKGE